MSSTPTANLLTGNGVDEYFTRTDSSGTRNLLTDALGSTLALADSSGVLQTLYQYDPYGNTTQGGSSNGNPLQYTARENDGTGLYFLRARYYSPNLQRFISEDPTGLRGKQFNLYNYVWNAPINYMDPSGTVGMGPIGGATAAAGLGWGAAGTASLGAGMFCCDAQGASTGVFGTFGAFAGGENQGWSYPSLPEGGPNGTLGAFVGLGAASVHEKLTPLRS